MPILFGTVYFLHSISMNTLLRVTYLLLLCVGFANSGAAQTTLIHYWDFNQIGTSVYNNPNIPAFKAHFSVIDTNAATINYVLAANAPRTYSGYVDGVAGDASTNLVAGDSAGTALRVRNPTSPDSMELQFHIPTTGYKNIVVKYALEMSGSGDTIEDFDYSIDGGKSWKSVGISVNGGSATFVNVNQPQFQGSLWGLVTLTFSDPAINNNANFILRLKFGGGRVNNPNGNNRIDNVTVEGAKATGGVGASVVTPMSELTVYPNPAREFIAVEMTVEVDGCLTILDAAGRLIEVQKVNAHEPIRLSLDHFHSGEYFATLRKSSGEILGRSKFTKL